MHCVFAPILASFYVSSLLRMFVFAFTLRMVTLWWEFFGGILFLFYFKIIVSTIWVVRSLSGWLYWEKGFLI